MRHNPPAKWVLPTNVHPNETVCFQIEVPKDTYYLAAFRGALLDLASAYKWADDTAHTAKEVASVWRNIIDNLQECTTDTSAITYLGENDNMPALRIVCVNNKSYLEYEACSCPETWVRLANIDAIVPSQPGDGSPQPAGGGGQACYQAVNQLASKQWLLPSVVNTGDVLTLSGATGAASDNNPAGKWCCPDGGQFFAGACIGMPAFISADPKPALAHMRLLYLINGVYYDAMSGAFTVPAGVSNQPVVVVPNTSILSSVNGSYSYQVCRTNNTGAVWTRTWDFTTSPGPFAAWNPSGTPLANWVAGVGWVDVNYTANLGEVTIVSNNSATINQLSFNLMVTETVTAPDHKDLGSGNVVTTLATAPLVSGAQNLPWIGASFTDRAWFSAFNSLYGTGRMVIVNATASGTGAPLS